MARNTATSLEDIANFFDTLASDQLAMNARGYGKITEQRERAIEARVWKEAAKMLRETDIVP